MTSHDLLHAILAAPEDPILRSIVTDEVADSMIEFPTRESLGLPDNVVIEYRDGVPESVSCTLADWVGGVCERCGGDRRHRVRFRDGSLRPSGAGLMCQHYKGTGRTPGIAKQVCEAWPVTRVVLIDVNPRPELGFRIELELLNVFNFPHTTWWATKSKALSALSHAALTYGRRLAGLPEFNK